MRIHAARTFVAALAPLSAQRAKSDEAATARALERLDAYTQGVAAADQFSGVVLVAKDGVVLSERAYGLRDEKREDPLEVVTCFDLASAGKMFTASAILQQIAAGKLTLTTTLGQMLPNHPNLAMRKATIVQLLTHSAGAGETEALFYPDDLTWRGREPNVADLVARYRLRHAVGIIGISHWWYGGTQFVTGNDDALHVLKFDDVDRPFQSPVTCRIPDAVESTST